MINEKELIGTWKINKAGVDKNHNGIIENKEIQIYPANATYTFNENYSGEIVVETFKAPFKWTLSKKDDIVLSELEFSNPEIKKYDLFKTLIDDLLTYHVEKVDASVLHLSFHDEEGTLGTYYMIKK